MTQFPNLNIGPASWFEPDVAYNSLVPAGISARSHSQVTALLGGLSLVPPGVVPVAEWRPMMGYRPQATDMYAGLAMTGRRGWMP
jgi:hypothetical protein